MSELQVIADLLIGLPTIGGLVGSRLARSLYLLGILLLIGARLIQSLLFLLLGRQLSLAFLLLLLGLLLSFGHLLRIAFGAGTHTSVS